MASDVQGVINDALKVLKQHITIHTCIDAIGNLRRTLASPDVVIRRKSAEWLSTATPTGEELIALWDAHSKVSAVYFKFRNYSSSIVTLTRYPGL